jgi:carbon monoxide dehydrogenase subunit G
MRLEERGHFAVSTSRETAVDYLTDADAVCHALPGEIHEVEGRGDDGVTVHLTVSHGIASEELRLRLYVDDSDAEEGNVSYTGHGTGSRMKVDLEGEFEIDETGDGLEIEWWGAADVGGVLSSLNRDIATVAVRDKLDETANNVRTNLEHRAAH